MVKVSHNVIKFFFMVPEVKRTIAVSPRKLFFDGFITESTNLNRGKKPELLQKIPNMKSKGLKMLSNKRFE